MLARLAREPPAGRFVYEPKWDGVPSLAFAAAAAARVPRSDSRPKARVLGVTTR
jgi:hypothetical protein